MTTGRLRYLAYLSEDPDMMADFYARHLHKTAPGSLRDEIIRAR